MLFCIRTAVTKYCHLFSIRLPSFRFVLENVCICWFLFDCFLYILHLLDGPGDKNLTIRKLFLTFSQALIANYPFFRAMYLFVGKNLNNCCLMGNSDTLFVYLFRKKYTMCTTVRPYMSYTETPFQTLSRSVKLQLWTDLSEWQTYRETD